MVQDIGIEGTIVPHLTSLGEAVNFVNDDDKFKLILTMFIRDYYYKQNDEKGKFNIEEVIASHIENYFNPEIKKLKDVRGCNMVNKKANAGGKINEAD